jgi:hypothetical protein
MNWYRAKRKSAVLSSSTIKHSSHYFSFFLSVCFSVTLSICFLCLFAVYLSAVCLTVFLSFCVCVSLSLCLLVSLSLCIPVSFICLLISDWFLLLLFLLYHAASLNLQPCISIFRIYVGLRVATLCIWSGNYSLIYRRQKKNNSGITLIWILFKTYSTIPTI